MASSSSKRIGSDVDLPEKLKQFKPSDNRVERKKIENLLNETRSILEEERVERLASLSQAEWVPSIQLAKVTKKMGRQWNTMGHTYLGDTVLYPEEALFLLETNAIEISYGGMPMSLQQAYSVLLGVNSTCTLEEYRVYSHLTKYGFKLRRHGCEPVAYRREGDEPPEIDVVGIICKRKSSGKTAAEENSVKEVKEEIPHKWNCELSTSSKNSKLNIPSVDDDDVKFIEFVDASKKRKVCDTIVIGDDIEILSSSVNEGSHSLSQSEQCSNNKLNRSEGDSEIPDQETKCESSDSLETSNSENLPVEGSVDSSTKPNRSFYKSNPFLTIEKDEEVCKCVPSSNATDKLTGDKFSEVQKNIPSTTKVSKESGDDVIVILSDDESNGIDKHKEELDKFYQEISLLEVIDISEDDDDEKAITSNGVTDRRVNENYDFWSVLGKIPVMKNGKLSILIPAPPSNLIPSNIRPVQNEYSINVRVTSEKPIQESGDSLRVRDGHHGKWKSFHRSSSSSSRGPISKSSRFHAYPPYHYQEWQRFHNSWNYCNAQYPHSNGFDPTLPSTSSQSYFGKQYPQSTWLSYVYTHRPYNKSFGHFQPRNGNSYHSRGHSRSLSHGRDWDRPSRSAADENEDRYISVVPKNPNAINWSEMKRSEKKQESVVITDEVPSNANEFSHQSKISPLLKPSDSVDVDAVLSKIQITTSAKASCDTSSARACSLSIKYDMYMPNSTFRKSCPGVPRYRLSVVKSNDSIPKLSDISYLTKDVKDEVPLLFAAGFPETINFFSFSNVDLPVQLKKES